MKNHIFFVLMFLPLSALAWISDSPKTKLRLSVHRDTNNQVILTVEAARFLNCDIGFSPSSEDVNSTGNFQIQIIEALALGGDRGECFKRYLAEGNQVFATMNAKYGESNVRVDYESLPEYIEFEDRWIMPYKRDYNLAKLPHSQGGFIEIPNINSSEAPNVHFVFQATDSSVDGPSAVTTSAIQLSGPRSIDSVTKIRHYIYFRYP